MTVRASSQIVTDTSPWASRPAVTAGLDAQGEVSVTISEGGRTVIGHGAHEDVLVASGKAYVHALNKLEWHRQSREVEEPRGI